MTTSDRLSETLERLAEHRERTEMNQKNAANEGQTRQYLIDPFIREVLGYDREDPEEVREAAAVGQGSDGRKEVDYALKRPINGKPEHYILVEAKTVGHNLGQKELDQLKEYVAREEYAKFGVLTDGIQYKWYRCPPKKTILEDIPFLTHSALEAPSPATCEWLAAVRRNVTDRDDLERLAWRLALENDIREWLLSTFVDPVNPTIINKAVGLKVPTKDHAVVSEAAKSVWHELQASAGPKPVDPPPSGCVEVIDRSDERIDFGEEMKTRARAWRIGTGTWKVENDATRVIESVLQSLLECDARRDQRDQLASLPEIVSWNSDMGGSYKRIPGFTELCFNAHRENPKKVTLLQEVSRKIEFRPPPDHALSKQPKIEVWMPTGTTYTKARRR